MSTAKVTELGGWVNVCKNIIQVQRIVSDETPGDADIQSKERWILVTDGTRMRIETVASASQSDEEEEDLPSLKTLRHLGIIHIDDTALMDNDAICQELFNREDIVVTMNESVQHTMEPPPGAAKTSIPKLAEIYKRRQAAIHSGNKRLASVIANAPPMDPARMLDRLGTASMVMGSAVFLLGGGMYLASSSNTKKPRDNSPKHVEPSEFHPER
jgi:protein-tyrosine-phosphatase